MTTTNKNAPILAGIDASDCKIKAQTEHRQDNSKPRDLQYKCSFCWRELPNGGLRFAGFGVCPPHLKLAETIVDLLRGHAANYSKRFGGVK
jgi:hypothetical protein